VSVDYSALPTRTDGFDFEPSTAALVTIMFLPLTDDCPPSLAVPTSIDCLAVERRTAALVAMMLSILTLNLLS